MNNARFQNNMKIWYCGIGVTPFVRSGFETKLECIQWIRNISGDRPWSKIQETGYWIKQFELKEVE